MDETSPLSRIFGFSLKIAVDVKGAVVSAGAAAVGGVGVVAFGSGAASSCHEKSLMASRLREERRKWYNLRHGRIRGRRTHGEVAGHLRAVPA